MEGFRERTLNVVCVDVRKMNSILSVKINKTDKNDARGIAKALRAGMFSVVHDKPKEAIDRGAVLSMRRCLVKQRTDIKNHIRGILKTYGIRLGSIGPEKFHERIKLHIDRLDPLVREALEGLLDLSRTKKWNKLKAWGLRLMKKKGIKKASLAVGRKLSVVMHRMLIEEKVFQYGEVNKKSSIND